MEDNSAADFIGDPCCDCSSWILANPQRPTNPCHAACLHLPTPIGMSLRTPSSVWPTLCGMKTTMKHRRSSNIWSTLSGDTLRDKITDSQSEGSIPAVGAGFVRSVQVVPPGDDGSADSGATSCRHDRTKVTDKFHLRAKLFGIKGRKGNAWTRARKRAKTTLWVV